jgi:UDP-glucose 4-epimerase
MACFGYREDYDAEDGTITRDYHESVSAQCDHYDCTEIPNPSIFA